MLQLYPVPPKPDFRVRWREHFHTWHTIIIVHHYCAVSIFAVTIFEIYIYYRFTFFVACCLFDDGRTLKDWLVRRSLSGYLGHGVKCYTPIFVLVLQLSGILKFYWIKLRPQNVDLYVNSFWIWKLVTWIYYYFCYSMVKQVASLGCSNLKEIKRITGT